MQNQKVFHIAIPQRFESKWEEFKDIIKADKDFQRILKEKIKTDKRYREGRQRSVMVRYVIAKYVKERKNKIKKEMRRDKDGIRPKDKN